MVLGFLAAVGTVGAVIALIALGLWIFTTYPDLVDFIPWVITGFHGLLLLFFLTAVYARGFERKGL